MLIGWFVARRDIRLRLRDLKRTATGRDACAKPLASVDRNALTASFDRAHHFAALRSPVVKLALPSAGLGLVIDRDGCSFECAPRIGHAAARPRGMR